MKKKKPKNIYMTDKTKDRLSRIAAEKHMHLGDLIDYMLDVIENKNENNIDELLTLQKQNKKLLSVIETHTELTTILFNELARTMQLEIKDESDSLGVTQAKKNSTRATRKPKNPSNEFGKIFPVGCNK